MKRFHTKRWLPLMMSCALLAGCGAGGGSETAAGTNGAEKSDSGSGTEAGTANEAEDAIAQRKESGNIPTLVVAFMNWSGSPKGLERVEEKMSEYTEETLGVRVKLEIMDSASYGQEMTLMLSSGEQVDIFNTNYIGYTSSINKGYCMDLEEDNLIQTYGSGILETFNSDMIDACRVDGLLYGVPQQRDMTVGLGGFVIGAEYLDGIGFDYASMYEEGDELIYTDIETIEDIFAQLHEAYPDKYVFAPDSPNLTQGNFFDDLARDNFGVLLDPENSLKVESLWSSEVFRQYCERMYKWNQAGYISKDALTDSTAPSAQVKAGVAMSYMVSTKVGIAPQEKGLCGRDIVVFQTGEDLLRASSVAKYPWSINSMTDYPVESMQLLNALYTDPVLSNFICWGEEGVDYVYTDDGHITFPEGVDADNAEYYNNVNWLLPNQFIAEIWEGNSFDIWEKTEEMNNSGIVSKALGFAFDNSAVANEYTALTNVFNEYAFQLMYGFVEPEAGIAELTAKMNEAGEEIYIEAKQEALDAWAKANGVE